MNKRGLLDPTPELPDDTLIGDVRFATRIRNALNAAGLKTVGEVREASDATLLSLQDLGSRTRLSRTSSRDPGLAVTWWCQAGLITPAGEAEWRRIMERGSSQG